MGSEENLVVIREGFTTDEIRLLRKLQTSPLEEITIKVDRVKELEEVMDKRGEELLKKILPSSTENITNDEVLKEIRTLEINSKFLDIDKSISFSEEGTGEKKPAYRFHLKNETEAQEAEKAMEKLGVKFGKDIFLGVADGKDIVLSGGDVDILREAEIPLPHYVHTPPKNTFSR